MALTDNLTSYWKFDESSGNASDSVASNTLTNNNTATYVAGKISNAINFVRASSQSATVTSDLTSAGAYSVAGWVYWTSLPATNTKNHFYGNMTTGANHIIQRIQLEDVSGTKSLRLQRVRVGVATDSATYTWTPSTTTWYHVAGTYDGTTMRLYVNATEVATASSTGNGTIDAGYGPQFGFGVFGAAEYMDGRVDETGLWSRALTGSEITELYNSGTGTTYPFTTAVSFNALSLGIAF